MKRKILGMLLAVSDAVVGKKVLLTSRQMKMKLQFGPGTKI